jgi:antitoxin MazE
MTTKIQKWGNSQGLRIAKDLLARARLAVGDEVELDARAGTIVVRPLRRVRGRHRLSRLVRRIPKDYRPEGEAWGRASGREAW